MPKRKRDPYDDVAGADGPSSRAVALQREQFEGALVHGKKALFRALKVGRSFERQKLGRRQKTAKETKAEEETRRLEAEVAALKGLELQAIAELHLYKTLLKVKSIAAAAAFPSWVAVKVEASAKTDDTATANVTARLYNSNPAKVAIEEILEGVRVILGAGKLKGAGGERVRAADLGERKREAGTKKTATEGHAAVAREENGEETGWSGVSGSEYPRRAENEDNDNEEDIYKHYASRLVYSSNDEDTSDPVGDSTNAARQSSYSPLHSPSSYPPLTSSPEPHPRSPAPSKSRTAKPPAPAPKATTFLPSLAFGGYYSGSESGSDPSDDEAGKIPTRKNRMGQQARRQLWEKKFGFKAKHLQNQPVESRDQGWDARRGAQGGDERGRRGRGRGGSQGAVGSRSERRASARSGGKAGVTGANSEAVQPRKKEGNEEALHPSWEAAKKLKEQKKAVVFVGTKIVFD